VDGVYTADPKKDPTAMRYDTLSFADALRLRDVSIKVIGDQVLCEGSRTAREEAHVYRDR
jgi:uridylate kinase